MCFALYATANAMARAYAPLLAPYGLTYSQYLVLLVLWEGDELSVGALGERLFLNSATLTPVLKRLEGMGLVVRRRGISDEREVRVSLAARGRALEAAMSDVPQAIFTKAALSETALDCCVGSCADCIAISRAATSAPNADCRSVCASFAGVPRL